MIYIKLFECCPNIQVGYHAGKPIESVAYYFYKLTLSFLWVYPFVFNRSERAYYLSYFIKRHSPRWRTNQIAWITRSLSVYILISHINSLKKTSCRLRIYLNGRSHCQCNNQSIHQSYLYFNSYILAALFLLVSPKEK